MKNSNIKKINTAGLVGYIISILLIIGLIASMVGVAILTAGAIAISKDNINLKMATSININSTGNFLSKLNSFISINGVDDLNDLINNDGEKLDDNDISELNIKEENGGLVIDVKTNEITVNLKRIIIALVLSFISLGAITVAVYWLKSLMKSLKNCETPFSEDIIKKMTRFANTLLVVVIFNMTTNGYWASIKSGSLFRPSVNLEGYLFVSVIYILIVVFKYGAKLQQESDETL